MSGKTPSKGGGKPPPSQNYRQSKGKQEIIECRICKKEMKLQNYETHLKSQHPQEDSKNRRTKSDKSIKSIENIFEKTQKQIMKRPVPETTTESEMNTHITAKRFAPDNLDLNQNSVNKAQNTPSLSHEMMPSVSSTKSPSVSHSAGEDDLLHVDLLPGDLPPGDLLHGDHRGADLSTAKLPAVSADDSAYQAKPDQDNPVQLSGTIDGKQITPTEALNTLVAKLAPLAQLEDDVISKLVENIEKIGKLSICGEENEKSEKKVENKKPSDFDLNTLIFSCHSVTDITNKFQEFEYDAELGGFVCCVCNTQHQNFVFSYKSELETDFTNKTQSREFSNLKKSLNRHLQTMAHKNSLEVITNKANIEYKEDSRNKAVALKICRIAYFLLKNGRPDTDFTTLIYLHSANGCDIGDINHSYNFPPLFLKHVARVIEDLLKNHLNTRLPQTGHKPPLKVVADKATWQHQTRQLIGIVTVVPDSDQPLQAMILKTPVVKSHTGKGVTENITHVTDQFITADQFRGGSFDGQYFHLGVHKLLDTHYDVTAQYDVDPMHRAGTVDLHLRKEKSSGWIVSMTSHIGKAFKAVNYGKLFEHFFEVCEDLSKLGYDIHFKFPRFYSETKFANYVRLVYGSFREDYPGLVRTFNEVKDSLKLGSSEDRQKAKEISALQGQILNLKFVLELSGSCDIYNRFGHGINILQKVNILPHTKYDDFVATVVDSFGTMADTVDPKDCPCDQNISSPKCLWPVLHKDLREIADNSTYRGVTIGNLMANELSTRAGERRAKQNLLLDQAGVTQNCLKKLKEYSKSLGTNLLAKVYQEDDKKLIETIRVILDLETLSLKLKLSGSAHVAAVQSKIFIQKSRELAPELSAISNEELRFQYRDFLRKLESYIEDKDEDIIFSMDIFRSFLSTELKLYHNVEIIIHIICVAATAISVESVVESWVSIYESHNNKHRPISNDRAEMEISVAVNGPLLQHADPVLKKALKDMYKDAKDIRNRGAGRFVRRNENVADYVVSKSVDALLMKPNSKPFMC